MPAPLSGRAPRCGDAHKSVAAPLRGATQTRRLEMRRRKHLSSVGTLVAVLHHQRMVKPPPLRVQLRRVRRLPRRWLLRWVEPLRICLCADVERVQKPVARFVDLARRRSQAERPAEVAIRLIRPLLLLGGEQLVRVGARKPVVPLVQCRAVPRPLARSQPAVAGHVRVVLPQRRGRLVGFGEPLLDDVLGVLPRHRPGVAGDPRRHREASGAAGPGGRDRLWRRPGAPHLPQRQDLRRPLVRRGEGRAQHILGDLAGDVPAVAGDAHLLEPASGTGDRSHVVVRRGAVADDLAVPAVARRDELRGRPCTGRVSPHGLRDDAAKRLPGVEESGTLSAAERAGCPKVRHAADGLGSRARARSPRAPLPALRKPTLA
mmetsp:Transcript_12535/g.35955  ORF Transcript_12535/g.35955 Transcript_12535/m.35955 type:complete len:375 (+) Transcript_12535:106-1230(+)